jgi:hypothetical protein
MDFFKILKGIKYAFMALLLLGFITMIIASL